MSEQIDIASAWQELLDGFARRVLEIYRSQVPSPSKNSPFATGRLRGSLEYRILQNNQVSIYFNRYGVYTDLGTGGYNQISPAAADPFGLPPNTPYSRGFGGIKPQYWTSLQPYTDELINEFVEPLAEFIETQVVQTTQRFGT